MMMLIKRHMALVAILLAFHIQSAAAVSTRLNVNPIRRVVTMLQMMQKKVESEGQKEQELYDKFMCYCKNGVGSLVESIKTNEAKVPQLESSIEETDALTKQLVADTKRAKEDKSEAEATIEKATGIRNKEAQAFGKFSAEAKADIASMGKAVQSLEKGTAGSFLQTRSASVLKRLSITMDISDADRDVLTTFLSDSQSRSQDADGDEAAPTGEIIGILKQMQATMTKELSEVTSREDQAVKDFAALTAAKQKQVATLTKEIEEKLVRSGTAGTQFVELKANLADTSKSLASDKKFLIDLTQNCKTKEAEKEVNDKMRADELMALADTIKILNDDDALDLFKKTLAQSSFLQLQVTSGALKRKALLTLMHGHQHGRRDFRLNLIELVLRGKKASFEKILKMIDDMIALLKKEQTSDTQKKAYCEKNIRENEDEFKDLQSDIKDMEKAIAENTESIKAVAAEIAALTKGIKDLDKQVKDATKQRKDEHTEYEATMASNGASKELLNMAKNRLAKFYSPKLYTAPQKRALSESEQITVEMGGTLAPTAAPGGIAGTGIAAAFSQYESEAQDDDQEEEQDDAAGFLQVRSSSRLRQKRAAPPPPPETIGAYKKSESGSSGVMQMLNVLISDLQKEMETMETNEKESQKLYEEFIADSAEKRAEDSKSISDKEGNKVELEATTLKMAQDKKGKMKESMALVETIQSLHGECDWLVKNYDARKEARSSEVESLNNAKAVLSGADLSFLQVAEIHHHVS